MRHPKRPETLPELAEATLAALSQEPRAANIILGGGVALQHYDPFRPTQDIDAWWNGFRDDETFERVRARLEQVAAARGYQLEYRRFGTTDSLEFKDPDRGKKVFSFQIAVRDLPLEEPLVSAWPPLRIETLHDNVGSKMNALVNRGAPRDFVDIFRVVQDGLLSLGECWDLWQRKNPGGVADAAKRQTLTHLTRLEQRRPLESITDQDERNQAQALRRWFREAFLAERKEAP